MNYSRDFVVLQEILYIIYACFHGFLIVFHRTAHFFYSRRAQKRRPGSPGTAPWIGKRIQMYLTSTLPKLTSLLIRITPAGASSGVPLHAEEENEPLPSSSTR